ncbi:MAG: thioredoxin domain-containing protein [Candidatus Diapherotrites archaeon]|nr:thioredoxin domain-containing protein [Candidatus Diapherotrites archaeon]
MGNGEVEGAGAPEAGAQGADAAPLKMHKKFSFNGSIPLYLGILLLVLGIVAGITVGKVTISCTNADSNANCPNPTPPKPLLLAKIVYDGQCDFCSKEISFLSVIEANDINKSVEPVDAYSEEGKALVKEHKFNFLPALLIDINSLSGSMQIKTNQGASISLKELIDEVLDGMLGRKVVMRSGNYFILPELPEFATKGNNISFIETPESCKLDANFARLDEFADYLCPYCASAVATVDALKEKFGSGLDYYFRNFVVHEEALKIANAAECARKQGAEEFDKFMRCAFTKKFTENIDTTDSNALKGCANSSGIGDMNAFETCMNEWGASDIVDLESGSDILAARAYQLSGTPSFVVDCRYVVGLPQVESVICNLHPDLDGCGAG